MTPLIFRPRYLGGALAVVFFLPAFVFGLFTLSLDLRIGFVFTLVGALGGTCGVGYLLRRVVVDDVGIRKSPGWFGGFRVAWSDIESWSIQPADPFENPEGCQILKLRVRGGFWPADVADYGTVQPGFDALIELLRIRIGEYQIISPFSGGSSVRVLPPPGVHAYHPR